MAEDIAKKFGLVLTDASDPTLSPGAIVALMLEIQSSLLENPDHAHLSEAAEDLLLALVRSIKEADASRGNAGEKLPATAPADAGRPQLRIVKTS